MLVIATTIFVGCERILSRAQRTRGGGGEMKDQVHKTPEERSSNSQPVKYQRRLRITYQERVMREWGNNQDVNLVHIVFRGRLLRRRLLRIEWGMFIFNHGVRVVSRLELVTLTIRLARA